MALPCPGFEGSEKRLEVDFCFGLGAPPCGLRTLSRAQLDGLLEKVPPRVDARGPGGGWLVSAPGSLLGLACRPTLAYFVAGYLLHRVAHLQRAL